MGNNDSGRHIINCIILVGRCTGRRHSCLGPGDSSIVPLMEAMLQRQSGACEQPRDQEREPPLKGDGNLFLLRTGPRTMVGGLRGGLAATDGSALSGARTWDQDAANL